MCWLPIEQPLLLPGDSTCSSCAPSPRSMSQRLASRLRRIGDQLEKSWTAGDAESGVRGAVAGRDHFKSFLCNAIHFTVLVLFGAGRHL